MKKGSNILKIFLFCTVWALGIPKIDAALKEYSPNDCNTNNPYWGMQTEYYINPGITLGVDVPLSSSDLDGIGSNLNANISTRFIYDIMSIRAQNDDTLEISGWAFNTTDERVGSGASAYQNLQFQLVATDNSQTIKLTDVRAGGSYNTKQWLCKRTKADKYTIKGSPGNFDWYKTAGECKVGSKAWGGMGFSLYIDLKDANLQSDKTYKLQMQYSGRGSGGWKDVSVAKGIADSISHTRNTDGMQVTITSGTDKVKIHSDGSPVGTNGMVCSLWGSNKTAAEAMNTHFNGGTYTYTGAKRTVELNSGDGGMNMYQVNISDNGSPGSNRVAYASSVFTEFDPEGVIKIQMGKPKDVTPGDAEAGTGKCEGKETYDFYYLFLATVENSYSNTMVTSADGARFNDYLILENDLQFTNISVTNQGEYKIDSSNLQTYYTWLQKALNGPSRYAKENNTYYIAYDSWCSIDQKTNKIRYCREAATGNAFNVAPGITVGPGEKWMNGGAFSIPEAIAATTVTDRGQSIRASKRSNNKGYQFNLERGFNAYPDGRPAMMGGTTKPVSSRFTDQEGAKQVSYHPMAYKITFCESEPGDCDDDTNQAVCPSGDEPAGAVFHENNDLKTCTIPKENSSGFTAIDTDETTAPNGKSYCILSCKEDIDIDLPGHKETAAGQYFKLDNYIPKIEAKRTCVTAGSDGKSAVDYDGFQNDLKVYEDRMPEEYNEWQDYLEIYTHLMSGSGVGDPNEHQASETCTIGSGSSAQTVTVSYTYQDWTINPWNAINDHSRDFDGDSGYWRSGTVCNNESGTTYEEALSDWQNEYAYLTGTAWNTYIGDFQDYRDTINAYNKCFSWNDPTDQAGNTGGSWNVKGAEPRIRKGTALEYEDYYYKFKPKVTFNYPDRDGTVFPVTYTYDYDGRDSSSGREEVEGTGIGKGSYPNTTVISWNKGGTTDNEYTGGNNSTKKSSPSQKTTNQVPRNILDCHGQTCTTSQVIEFKFYDSAFIKREEEVDYEYHLPRVYTKVPSGVVSTEDRLAGNATWLELDEEAVPVNINTLAGTYDYTISFTELINEKDGDIRAVTKANGKNSDDNFQERFNGATGNGALNDGENYVCNYDVLNDAYIPDPSKYNFFYRTIDPYDINPVNRTLGYNWNDERGQVLQERMAEAEADYQVLINRDKFVFTLTPTIMKQLRDYNKSKSNNSDGGYADWDLVCDDYGEGGYHCYSNLLSCFASGGTMPQAETGLNCGNVFGDSLSDYLSEYSDYDWSDLDANRRALIQKQNEVDCNYGHAKADAC